MKSFSFKATIAAAAVMVAVPSFADGINARATMERQSTSTISRAIVRAELQQARMHGLAFAIDNSYPQTTMAASQPGMTRAQVRADLAATGGPVLNYDLVREAR